jgi:nucleotide-binding universal stress UspA family protein
VQFGNPAERIVSYARRPEIDLIVMATHGRTGLRTVIFGSVAGRVLFSGARPVLLVRPGKLYDEPEVFWPTETSHSDAATRR